MTDWCRQAPEGVEPNVTFAELLRQYTGKRPLEDIVALCAQRGLNIHATYISKLRTGDRPAPENEDSIRILAEVCGRNPEPLLFLAAVERTPGDLLQVVLDTLAANGTAGRPWTLGELIRRLQGLPVEPPQDLTVRLTVELDGQIFSTEARAARVS